MRLRCVFHSRNAALVDVSACGILPPRRAAPGCVLDEAAALHALWYSLSRADTGTPTGFPNDWPDGSPVSETPTVLIGEYCFGVSGLTCDSDSIIQGTST